MDAVAGEHSVLGVLNLIFAGDVVALLQIDAQVGVITVAPLCSLGVPRQAAAHQVKAAEQVVPQMAGQRGVPLQDGDDVLGRAFHHTLAVALQGVHPVRIGQRGLGGALLRVRGGVNGGEVVGHTGHTLARQQTAHALVGGHEVQHAVLGWQSCNIGDAAVLVLNAELVDAHQVVGVAELQACGVRLMVGVGELALIRHQAACHTAVAVGVAALHGRGLVDVGEESLNGLLYGVGAAESANQTGFLRGVARLAQLV